MGFSEARSLTDGAAILERAAHWPEDPQLGDLTPAALCRLTSREGVDFATAVLFDRIRKSPVHAPFIRKIEALQTEPPRRGSLRDLLVVIVPGALYRERPDLGGDGRLVREVAAGYGCDTELIPLASAGSVLENARRIQDWLAGHDMRKLVLVSLSKGGAELALALANPQGRGQFRNVVAWVNVCGPLQGTYLADWILASYPRTWFFRLQYAVQRRDFRFITELARGPGSPLNVLVALPEGLRVFNLVGFPLRHHLTTTLSRACHRILTRHGPNDGTISLADLPAWPGKIYPAWGMDHYFRPQPEAEKLIRAQLAFLAEVLKSAQDPAVMRDA